MSDDEFAALIGATEQDSALQLAQAQACLDLFEKDRGRRAFSLWELRAWADVQDVENLRFRIERRLRSDQAWTKACKSIWNDVPVPLASRPPIGQRISFTLAEAAKATGRSEAAILEAITQGRIAGVKDVLNVWHVERAGLLHVFPLRGAQACRDADDDSAPADVGNDRPLDAVTLMLEVGISTLVRQAGNALRQRPRPWWRRRTG
jgi:hypothetical protein